MWGRLPSSYGWVTSTFPLNDLVASPTHVCLLKRGSAPRLLGWKRKTRVREDPRPTIILGCPHVAAPVQGLWERRINGVRSHFLAGVRSLRPAPGAGSLTAGPVNSSRFIELACHIEAGLQEGAKSTLAVARTW